MEYKERQATIMLPKSYMRGVHDLKPAWYGEQVREHKYSNKSTQSTYSVDYALPSHVTQDLIQLVKAGEDTAWATHWVSKELADAAQRWTP